MNLGGGVTTIEHEAFKFDSAMTSLTVPGTVTEIGDNILEGHGDKLTVTCPEGSAMDTWLKEHEPGVNVTRPKTKKK